MCTRQRWEVVALRIGATHAGVREPWQSHEADPPRRWQTERGGAAVESCGGGGGTVGMPRRISRRLEAPVVPKRAAKALHNGIGLGRRGMQWECGATVRTFCAKQTAYAPTRSALDPRCAPDFDPVIRTYTASRRGWLPPGASSGGLTRSPFPRVPAASFSSSFRGAKGAVGWAGWRPSDAQSPVCVLFLFRCPSRNPRK